MYVWREGDLIFFNKLSPLLKIIIVTFNIMIGYATNYLLNEGFAI